MYDGPMSAISTAVRRKSTKASDIKVFSRYPDPLYSFIAAGEQHQKLSEEKKILSTTYRKHNGVYYTPYSIAQKIIGDLLEMQDDSVSINNTFLDPCCGHGIFVIAYLDWMISKLGLNSQADIQNLFDNVYYADRDGEAVHLLQKGVVKYIKDKYAIDLTINPTNGYIGNSLYEYKNREFTKVDLKQIFKIREGFSLIATNPPYRLLKANSGTYYGDESVRYKDDLKVLITAIKNSNSYPLNEGTLNIYKLFVEEILSHLSAKEGLIGLLIPQTLLNDKHSLKLRIEILNNELSPIYIIPENNYFFSDVSQSFCFFGVKKGSATNCLSVVSDVATEKDLLRKGIKIKKNKLASISKGMPVIAQGESGWSILEKLHTAPSLMNIPEIINLRGELDLTLNKNNITTKPTGWTLIRGVHLDSFRFKKSDEFVDSSFIALTPKKRYIRVPRIACQQISNIKSKKRLKFALMPAGSVLGNSCNFIAFDERSLWSTNSPSLKYILGILNSSILEWRFRLTSSNNHVSNYELGNLPIPTASSEQIKQVEDLVDSLLANPLHAYLEELDQCVAKIFNLSPKELEFIYNDMDASQQKLI